jgi:hypothetical protein
MMMHDVKMTRKIKRTNNSNIGFSQAVTVWDPRTYTKPWFPPHLADIDGTASLTFISEGGLGNSEKKKWKNSAWSHGE